MEQTEAARLEISVLCFLGAIFGERMKAAERFRHSNFQLESERELRVPYDEALEMINNVLDTLPQREEVVLTMRYGLEDGWLRTHEEIASVIDVELSRLPEIEAGALRKMRHPSRSEVLRELVSW